MKMMLVFVLFATCSSAVGKYVVNTDTNDRCQVGTPIQTPAECQRAAAALGQKWGGDQHQLDYVVPGCFMYDGESREHNGVYWNNRPHSKVRDERDHHKVCRDLPPPGQCDARVGHLPRHGSCRVELCRSPRACNSPLPPPPHSWLCGVILYLLLHTESCRGDMCDDKHGGDCCGDPNAQAHEEHHREVLKCKNPGEYEVVQGVTDKNREPWSWHLDHNDENQCVFMCCRKDRREWDRTAWRGRSTPTPSLRCACTRLRPCAQRGRTRWCDVIPLLCAACRAGQVRGRRH